LYETLTEICYFGNGGYTFDIVYEMPIWLRRVTYGHLSNFKQMEADAKSGNKKDEKLDNASTDRLKKILQERSQSTTGTSSYTTKAHK